ncbi:hypothetical protein [Nonomuraea dietziae]|uniref:hypothetical protein n=1 Tax=Nonomuraea dietziae TaxID=65515 RepID=UPI00340EEC85
MIHDTTRTLGEVPWPDQPSPELEVLALCCPECGNNELVAVYIPTDEGSERALECSDCREVYPDVR